MFCNPGEKPTVIYSFNGGTERTYKPNVSPIDVEIVDLLEDDGTANYQGEGFKLTVTALDGFVWIDGVVKDYRVDRGTDYETYSIIPCGSSDWQVIATLSLGQNLISVNPNIKCPSSSDECFIRIKYQGVIIFKDRGKRPCNFQVQCGRCPEGQCECSTPNYPGYCCIDCAELSGEIKGIRNTVRGIRNG